MQRVIREIDLDGLKVQVRELTVGDIRAWLASKTDTQGDLVDSMLFDEISLDDLATLTDIAPATLDGLTPSAIERVVAVAREVNGRFFMMREKTVAIGQRILAHQMAEQAPAA